MARRWIAGSLAGAALAGALPGCGAPGGSRPAAAASRPDVLIAEGAAWYQEGRYDSAAARFTEALDLARREADPRAEARATYHLGRVAYGRDDFAAAREQVTRALDLQQRLGLDDQLFDSHNLLGLIAYWQGLYVEAERWARLALELATASADTTSLLKAWNNLALPLTELGRFAEARALLGHAARAAQALGNPGHQGRVLANLGMLAVRTGEPAEGARVLAEALTLARGSGDRDNEVNALGQLGTALAAMGDAGAAIARLDSAVELARRHALPQEEASNLELLAEVYRDAGEYPRALRLLEAAFALNRELGLRDEAAADQRYAAHVHLRLGNRDLARRSLEQALALHRELGARLNEFHDLLLLALVLSEAGDAGAAQEFVAAARDVADQLDSRASRVAVGLTAARLADRAGRPDEVLRQVRGVRPDLGAAGTDREWEAHWLAARAHARQGALGPAAEAGRRAVEAVERVRGGLGSDRVRTSLLSGREEVYLDLVDILLRLGAVDEAFQTADRARGRSLVEHLATVRPDGAPSVRDLAEEERQLLRQIDTVSHRIDRARRSGGGVPRDALRGELDHLYREADRIRVQYADALSRAEQRESDLMTLAGGLPPEAGRVQAALNPREALLGFLEGPDRVLLFVVTGNRTSVFRRDVGRGATGTRIRVLRELLLRPDGGGGRDVAERALEALHELLLGDARRAGALAGSTALVVVPHGQLAYVPFAALRDPATGRFLMEDFSVLHLPSAAALPVVRQPRWRPGRDSAAVAFAPFPGELPGTLAEVEALRAVYRGLEVRRGRAATEASVRAALAEAGVVHLATHGVLNGRSPLFSRIELARGAGGVEDNGRLEVHELTRMGIAARLVFLSGCETGLGLAGSTAFGSGEDYTTLARAFLRAGAANVVATLWRVEDRGAAAFATRFYRNLAEAERRGAPASLPEVLGRTQREMVRDPRYGSPFHWAGYQVSGSGRGGDRRPQGQAPESVP